MRASGWSVAAFTFVAAACGGAPPPAPSTAQAAPASPASSAPPSDPGLLAQGAGSGPSAAERALASRQMCDAWFLRAKTCEPLRRMRVTAAQCPATFDKALADKASAEFMRDTGACVVDHERCEDIINCMSRVRRIDPTAPGKLRACDASGSGYAVGVPRAAWERRRGANVTTFRQAVSTKAQPLEACGVAAATDFLRSLRCDDGKQRLFTVSEVEAARLGNVGAGGRCQSVVDHYRVRCPEQAYDIYVDAYVCPLP